MSTVIERIAREIIDKNGYYLDDPRVSRVVSYDNQWGGKSWALIYPHEDQQRYHNSPACRNVKIEWEAK